MRLKYLQSTESNTTNSRLFVDSFIAVTQPDHLMSLKINVWGCSVEMNENSGGIQMMSVRLHWIFNVWPISWAHYPPSQQVFVFIQCIRAYCVNVCICDALCFSRLSISVFVCLPCRELDCFPRLSLAAPFGDSIFGGLTQAPHSLSHWHTFQKRNTKTFRFFFSCLKEKGFSIYVNSRIKHIDYYD